MSLRKRSGQGNPATLAPSTSGTLFGINFGPRNGEDHQADILGPKLSNVFGTGANGTSNPATAVAGALGIRVMFQPGALFSTTYGVSSTLAFPVFGSGSTTTTRAQTLYYYGSGAAQAGFAGRFVWAVQDGNAHYGGDRDPTTGAAGSGAASRGLRTPVISVDNSGMWRGLVVDRMTSASIFEVFYIQDGVKTAGDSYDASANWVGNATPTNFTRWGCKNAPTAAFGDYFPGSLCDFVQLDGASGTDAEWIRYEQGEDPVTIWGANVAAYFRLGSTTDLAQTSGSRSYAAGALEGAGHINGTMFRPTKGTSTAANSLLAVPLYRGFVHSVDPVDVIAAAAINLAAVQAVQGTVSRDVFIGGAATHVQARAIDTRTQILKKDWTRVTVAAASGTVATLLPGVPMGVYRLEYRREDDTACVSISRQSERVGIGYCPMSQSQLKLGIVSDSSGETLLADGAASTGAENMVSFAVARNTGNGYSELDGGLITNNKQVSEAVLAAAHWWNSLNCGIPLEIILMCEVGTGLTDWIYRSTTDNTPSFTFDLAGDGASKTSGFATQMLLAKRGRITAYGVSWWTNDAATRAGGAYAVAHTVYTAAYPPNGAVNPTELPWADRMNEWFGGTPKAGAGAQELSERTNLVKLGAVFKPWMLIAPRSRSRDATNNPASTASVDTFSAFRKTQFDYAVSGTGLDATRCMAAFGGWQMDAKMPTGGDVHQDQADARGNIRFFLRMVQALAVNTAAWSASLGAAFTGAAGVGTNVLTLSTSRPNGGALMTAVAAAVPGEFEVSEAGGAWSKSGGTIAFTAALVGNTVTLSRNGGGNWNADTRIWYLRGWPNALGNTLDAAEITLMGGNLFETKADAVPPNISGATNASLLVAGLPLAPSLVPMQAT